MFSRRQALARQSLSIISSQLVQSGYLQNVVEFCVGVPFERIKVRAKSPSDELRLLGYESDILSQSIEIDLVDLNSVVEYNTGCWNRAEQS